MRQREQIRHSTNLTHTPAEAKIARLKRQLRDVEIERDIYKKGYQHLSLIRQSMSRKANCWDNAMTESFFKTLKTKCIYGNRFLNQKVAAMEVFESIGIWYNTTMLHSSLGYCTPVHMEQLLNQKFFAA